MKPSAAFSGPVLFFPEKRVFFRGRGGGGGGGEKEEKMVREAGRDDYSKEAIILSISVKRGC